MQYALRARNPPHVVKGPTVKLPLGAVGARVGIDPVVLADFMGTLGRRIGRELPRTQVSTFPLRDIGQKPQDARTLSEEGSGDSGR